MTSRRLRVAVDLTAVLPGGDNGGAKVLTVELLSSLARLAPQHSFLLLTARDSHPELAHLEALGMQRRCVLESRRAAPGAAPPAGASVRPAIRDSLRRLLPAALRRAGNRAWARLRGEQRIRFGEPDPQNRGLVEEGVDVLFCPFTAPVRAEPDLPVVSVVYDLQHLAYPQFFTTQERANRDALLRVLEERADRLICISQYARARFLENLRVAPERVTTIPIAVHARLPRLSPAEARASRARLGVERPYVFYPANFWPHKNHRLLLTAYGALRARRPGLVPDLVLTGALAEPAALLAEAVQAMGLAPHVRMLGYLPEADLAALFEGALFVVFPSLYEGFGMPVLEAMHFGKAVACSDVTSLPEVAGDAALFFDPRRPDEIARALLRLLDEPELRESLARRGAERVAALDVDRMARAYLDVLAAAACGSADRGPSLSGVHSDGWLGERSTLQFGAPGTCELDLFAPPWLRARAVAVTATAHGRPLGAWRLRRDSRLTVRFAVDERDRRVEIRCAPVFRPAAPGSGGDERLLSCRCEGARLVGAAGAYDLLAARLPQAG
ncbi:MAG: glycosyltransferase family 1 protein [Vicinamibacteria bacterium]